MLLTCAYSPTTHLSHRTLLVSSLCSSFVQASLPLPPSLAQIEREHRSWCSHQRERGRERERERRREKGNRWLGGHQGLARSSDQYMQVSAAWYMYIKHLSSTNLLRHMHVYTVHVCIVCVYSCKGRATEVPSYYIFTIPRPTKL